MATDIELLKDAGADGFVFGCLTPAGLVDVEANSMLLSKHLQMFPNERHLICSLYRESLAVTVHISPSLRHGK